MHETGCSSFCAFRNDGILELSSMDWDAVSGGESKAGKAALVVALAEAAWDFLTGVADGFEAGPG